MGALYALSVKIRPSERPNCACVLKTTEVEMEASSVEFISDVDANLKGATPCLSKEGFTVNCKMDADPALTVSTKMACEVPKATEAY